jgi:DNA-binding HxlR family transcriptional regulator
MLPGVRVCPVADALDVVGDRWSLLILREVGFGVHRFNDIQRHTGAPRDRLSTRLRKLEEQGVLERRPYQEHPRRYEYLLTAKGQALAPVIEALKDWGARHTPSA